MHDSRPSGPVYSLQPALPPKQKRLAWTHAMTNAVAGGSIKQDSIFNLALTRGSFEDDLVDPSLYPHLASTKLSHCRREQKILMLSIGIERFLNLRQRFHSYSITRLKTQGYACTVLCSRTRHKSPTSESGHVRDLVVNCN